MPVPVVTGFTANGNLGSGVEGLKSKNNSTTPTTVTGTDLADGNAVHVSNNGGITWDGNLNLQNGTFKANLKCTNNSTGLTDSEDVSVTVTNSEGPSAPYVAKVNVGTGE